MSKPQPKRGSLKRMLKSYLGIRISQKHLDTTAEYAVDLLTTLLASSHDYAQHARRSTILLSDVEGAVQSSGLSLVPIKNITISELKKCNSETRRTAASNKATITKKANAKGLKRPDYSSLLSKLLSVSVKDYTCFRLLPGAVKRLSKEILVEERLATIGKDNKPTRISADALALIQLILEREVLRYAAASAAVAAAGRSSQVNERHAVTARSLLRGNRETSNEVRIGERRKKKRKAQPKEGSAKKQASTKVSEEVTPEKKSKTAPSRKKKSKASPRKKSSGPRKKKNSP